MNYISCEEAAKRRNLKLRTIQNYCAKGLIFGAKKFQGVWLIPDENECLHYLPSIVFTNNIMCTYDDLDYWSRRLFDAQILYFNGDIELAEKMNLDLIKETDNKDILIGCYLTLNTIYMYKGELNKFLKYQKLIENIEVTNDEERYIKDLYVILSNTSMYLKNTSYQWLEAGNFYVLPKMYYNVAKLVYAKIFLIQGSFTKMQAIIEPFIYEATVDNNVLLEIYLRMMACVMYDYLGLSEKKEYHLLEAVKLGSKYHILSPFIEYRRNLGKIMDKVASTYDPDFGKEIVRKYNEFIPSWINMYNKMTNMKIVSDLTDREYEVARLTVANYTNAEIAKMLGISINAVKLYLRNVYEKIGISKRSEIHKYI